MSHSPFPPEIRTMSVVRRWSIVRTIEADTVANHSYYVTFYAHQIARMIEWRGSMGQLMYIALMHDLPEIITGDITGPVKKHIVDEHKLLDFTAKRLKERVPVIYDRFTDLMAAPVVRHKEIHNIVTAADRLDAVLFLAVEKRMGNALVNSRLASCTNRLHTAWMNLPYGETDLMTMWMDDVMPAIAEHNNSGGDGIDVEG